MASTIIQAVRINLPETYTQDASIGLYTDEGASFFAWSETLLSGVSDQWKEGLVTINGFGVREEAGSLEIGGNVANYAGMDIVLADAEILAVAIKNLGINLTGLKAIVYEFVGTVADSDATSFTQIFDGIVEDQTWNDIEFTIKLRNARYKRNALVVTVNANKTVTPVTIGKHYPPTTKILDGVAVASTEISNLAKFVRTVDNLDEDTYSNAFFDGDHASYPGVKVFPIETIYADHLHYACRMPGSYGNIWVKTSPEDVYVLITEGDGVGQIRQIDEWETWDYSDYYTVYFKIKDVLLTELSVTGNDRSWVRFVKIGREYAGDVWPCKDFLKTADGTATTIPELHTYESEKFNRIADFGFTVKDTNNNALDIEGSQYSNDIDNVDSFIVLPVTSFELIGETNLNEYGVSGTWSKYVDGVYIKPSGSVPASISGNTLSNASYAYDKNSTTEAEFFPEMTYAAGNNAYAGIALKFSLPEIPENVEVDNIYIGLLGHSNAYYNQPAGLSNVSLMVGARRFKYTKTSDYFTKAIHVSGAQADVHIDDLPDKYYDDTVSTNNVNFYRQSTVEGDGKWTYLYGYELFEIDAVAADIKKEVYKSYQHGFLIFSADVFNTYASDVLGLRARLNEIAVIFKLSSSSIKKEIYVPLSGRIFNSTWGSRKTAANLIESPVDVIEHFKRLQNWSELGGTYDWGKEYDPSAQIEIGAGEGSFDSANLNYLTDQKCCFQITDENKGTTDAIVKKLCDTFGLCSYIDSAGDERLATLETIAPAESITLSDIIGGIGDVIEPQIQNIFVQPIVNYQYNQGSGKFDRTLSVTNIEKSAWQASYTPGYTLSDGERVWNACKALYAQYRNIEQCPSEFSDQYMIADYATAVAYVLRKINWMTRFRVSFTTSYAKAGTYHIFKHIMVSLPHHTNGASVECIIEKLRKDKNKGLVSMTVVVLEGIITEWQDTPDTGPEYQDTESTGSEIVDN